MTSLDEIWLLSRAMLLFTVYSTGWGRADMNGCSNCFTKARFYFEWISLITPQEFECIDWSLFLMDKNYFESWLCFRIHIISHFFFWFKNAFIFNLPSWFINLVKLPTILFILTKLNVVSNTHRPMLSLKFRSIIFLVIDFSTPVVVAASVHLVNDRYRSNAGLDFRVLRFILFVR